MFESTFEWYAPAAGMIWQLACGGQSLFATPPLCMNTHNLRTLYDLCWFLLEKRDFGTRKVAPALIRSQYIAAWEYTTMASNEAALTVGVERVGPTQVRWWHAVQNDEQENRLIELFEVQDSGLWDGKQCAQIIWDSVQPLTTPWQVIAKRTAPTQPTTCDWNALSGRLVSQLTATSL